MIRIAIASVVMLVLCGLSSATAEIYKYRDAQGVTRYTYDLGEVPEDQRPGIKTYEEEVRSVGETTTPAEQEEAASTPEPESTPADEGTPVVDDQKIEELNQKKKALDQEFAGLMEEKYALIKEKERLDTLAGRDAVAVAAYDASVKELNRKIADYQKRQEAFQDEAQAVKEAVEKAENPDS